MAERRGRLGDTVFALVHLALLAGAAVTAVLALLKGDTWRFLIVSCILLVYYFAVLDKPVRKEIARRRDLRRSAPGKGPQP